MRLVDVSIRSCHIPSAARRKINLQEERLLLKLWPSYIRPKLTSVSDHKTSHVIGEQYPCFTLT